MEYVAGIWLTPPLGSAAAAGSERGAACRPPCLASLGLGNRILLGAPQVHASYLFFVFFVRVSVCGFCFVLWVFFKGKKNVLRIAPVVRRVRSAG